MGEDLVKCTLRCVYTCSPGRPQIRVSTQLEPTEWINEATGCQRIITKPKDEKITTDHDRRKNVLLTSKSVNSMARVSASPSICNTMSKVLRSIGICAKCHIPVQRVRSTRMTFVTPSSTLTTHILPIRE